MIEDSIAGHDLGWIWTYAVHWARIGARRGHSRAVWSRSAAGLAAQLLWNIDPDDGPLRRHPWRAIELGKTADLLAHRADMVTELELARAAWRAGV